jgi:hypothetical protein
MEIDESDLALEETKVLDMAASLESRVEQESQEGQTFVYEESDQADDAALLKAYRDRWDYVEDGNSDLVRGYCFCRLLIAVDDHNPRQTENASASKIQS